jgi:hypothetical protein
MVLVLTSTLAPPPCLPRPTRVPKPDETLGDRWDKKNDELFQSIDKCISLSCVFEGVDSLMCAAFFDPSVPCNLVGAQITGIKNALRPSDNEYRKLAASMTRKCPRFALLWLATIWSGQSKKIFRVATSPLPLLNLALGFWCRTSQSFLQVNYSPISNRTDVIPRTREFSTIYFAQQNQVPSWCRAPPFGSTLASNVSLEVNEHLSHDHRPLRYISCWLSGLGEYIPMHEPRWIDLPLVQMQLPLDTGDSESK